LTQAKISSFKNPHIKIDLLPRGQNLLSYYIYLYNKLGWLSFSIRPFCRLSRRSFVPPSIQGKEREEEEDSWWWQHVRTQSLASVIFAKSIQTFGGEIASMEQYTHQDPQPMIKAKFFSEFFFWCGKRTWLEQEMEENHEFQYSPTVAYM